jgi:hypothetical protein
VSLDGTVVVGATDLGKKARTKMAKNIQVFLRLVSKGICLDQLLEVSKSRVESAVTSTLVGTFRLVVVVLEMLLWSAGIGDM